MSIADLWVSTPIKGDCSHSRWNMMIPSMHLCGGWGESVTHSLKKTKQYEVPSISAATVSQLHQQTDISRATRFANSSSLQRPSPKSVALSFSSCGLRSRTIRVRTRCDSVPACPRSEVVSPSSLATAGIVKLHGIRSEVARRASNRIDPTYRPHSRGLKNAVPPLCMAFIHAVVHVEVWVSAKSQQIPWLLAVAGLMLT